MSLLQKITGSCSVFCISGSYLSWVMFGEVLFGVCVWWGLTRSGRWRAGVVHVDPWHLCLWCCAMKRCCSRGVHLWEISLFAVKHHQSDSGTSGQALSHSRGEGCAEVLQCFLQETLGLVKQKSDFEAVTDPNHSGAVIPIRILCSRGLDDFMHTGGNCCLQLLHCYWNIQE